MTTSSIVQFGIQVVAAGGGGALVVWLLGKGWADKWLAHRFDRNLAGLKSQHDLELEKFRQSASQQLEQRSRLNEAEFDLAKRLWKAIREATLQASAASMRFREYDDISVRGPEKAGEIMRRYGVREHHVEEILSHPPSEWNQLFAKALDMYDVDSATAKLKEASDLLGEAEIFLPSAVTDPIDQLIKLAHGALINTKMDMRGTPSSRSFDRLEEFHTKSNPLLDEVKAAIRRHFGIELSVTPD